MGIHIDGLSFKISGIWDRTAFMDLSSTVPTHFKEIEVYVSVLRYVNPLPISDF